MRDDLQRAAAGPDHAGATGGDRRSLYPLGLDLTGRTVVVVGGGPVAARRTRGLLDAGAVVRLVAPTLCEDLVDLVAEHGLGGTLTPPRLEWRSREYAGPPDLTDAWLVHTATGDRPTDEQVGRHCADRRIWCIDAGSGTRSTARVPASVRLDTPDGPVGVAVTAGGDPRRAVAVREQLSRHLLAGEVDLRRRRPRRGTGWVALVGGGPGDEGLLTTRARVLLAAADVVVVDRLAPRSVLATLPEDVLVIDVGKTPGHHPVGQDAINDLLVEHAHAGRGVVRLKGGDPYVLGRGGEEARACEAAGIPVEVVPGVTSALAVPAAVGIPVTHRGLARGFSVVTGHDELPDLPIGNDHTVVILMGVVGLRRSVATLLAAGRAGDCPAAVVEDGFGPGERITVAPLHRLADAAEAAGVRSPAVVVIGDVVTLAPAWPGEPAAAGAHAVREVS